MCLRLSWLPWEHSYFDPMAMHIVLPGHNTAAMSSLFYSIVWQGLTGYLFNLLWHVAAFGVGFWLQAISFDFLGSGFDPRLLIWSKEAQNELTVVTVWNLERLDLGKHLWHKLRLREEYMEAGGVSFYLSSLRGTVKVWLKTGVCGVSSKSDPFHDVKANSHRFKLVLCVCIIPA